MFPNPQPYFASLTDPRRVTKNKLHPLGDIVFVVLSAVLSGIEDWVGIEEFALSKIAWLRQFVDLPAGVPSHDTLSDVMGRIDPTEFTRTFTKWVEAALPTLVGEHIAIDGKTLRGSSYYGEGAVHLMSAFASRARWVLTQRAVDEKSNEITAIPDLLSFLDIRGATITIDAMGTQKSIAKQIVEAGADYVLALKENQPTMYAEAKRHLEAEDDVGRLVEHETVDTGRRSEIRRYVLSEKIEEFTQSKAWPGLQAVGMVESIRDSQSIVSVERRFFITSVTDVTRFAEAVRAHWSIENAEHWVLDVQFGEDRNRSRKDHSAENLALIRRMSLNILRRNETDKRSIKRRKLRAALNDGYRASLLFGTDDPT
jgi:predicted transposase YbfD/YdcC